MTDGELEYNQPQSTREKKPADLLCRFSARDSYSRTDAGKKKERWRTEVRNPSREKQERRRLRQVFRSEPKLAEEVARMVERHHDHHEPAKQID